MFLVIKNGLIIERGSDEEALLEAYPSSVEIVEWTGPLPPYDPGVGEPQLDPRTDGQKTSDNGKRYRRRRLRAYPSLRKQLDMIYWDKVDGTTLWVDEIKRIKELFPKP